MKRIYKQALVNAHRSEVWNDWTDAARIPSFFAPAADIELAIGGKYEMYFLPDNPEGKRGSEGCRVLSFLPGKMLSFSWNAPPHLDEVRNKRTWVVIDLAEMNEFHTKLNLTHLGWGEGGQWDAAYEYFEKAWDTVLRRLEEKYVGSEV